MDKNGIKNYYEKMITNSKNTEGLFNNPNDDLFFLSLPIDYSRKPLKCVELGYGTGRYAEYLAERGVHVTAVDLVDKAFLLNRLEGKGYKDNIKVIQSDIESFQMEEMGYDIVIARNVLHYLPRKGVERTIFELIKHTNYQGVHYITLFTNIVRYDRGGNVMVFPEEARYSTSDAVNTIKMIYNGWNVSIKVEKYSELDESGLFDYFSADCIYISAQNTN